jgi:WhiB family redox-sensing transcriptional regulator
MTATTAEMSRDTRNAAPCNVRKHDWRDDSACRYVDPELHFPVGTRAEAQRQTEQAKAVCARCPVITQCREWALETRQRAGVWGGLSEDDRLRLQGRRSPRRRVDGLSATDRILRNRLAEFRQLEASGLGDLGIAQRLGTNVQTVNRVRRRLAEQAAQAVNGVEAA